LFNFSQNDPIKLVKYDRDLKHVLGTYKSVSMSIPLRLKAGDVVSLIGPGDSKLAENASNHYTHFTGWLVEEVNI